MKFYGYVHQALKVDTLCLKQPQSQLLHTSESDQALEVLEATPITTTFKDSNLPVLRDGVVEQAFLFIS